MKHKLLSLFTAGMMLVSASALPPASAADQPSMDSVIGTLPDWTPMNFADALQFYNTYGKSHVEDNFICLVKPIRLDEKDKYKTSISGSMTMVNTPACTSPAIFSLEIPEQPDPNDAEALAEYEEYCESLDIPTDDYSFFEAYRESEVQYGFEVQFFRVLEGEDLTITWLEKEEDVDRETEKFSFENPGGFIEQTDLYSWVPDCPAEYEAFQSFGRTYVYYEPYITYCADVNASTGASLQMEQSGDGAIEYYMESDCNGFDLLSKVYPVDGSGSSSVIVYKPTADGVVDVEWSVGQHWSDAAPFDTTYGIFEIRNNCSEVEYFWQGCTEITFIDQETGELIDIPENSSFVKSTIQQSPDDDCCSELYGVSSNPCTVDTMTAYDPNCSYSFDIRTEDGYYDLVTFEVTAEEEQRIRVNCYLRYKTNPAPVLPDGATRITLYDKDTGELIPDEVLKYHNFTFGTNIGIKNESVPGGMMYTGPFYTVDSNSFILENDQLAYYYKYADLFEFTTGDEPEVIYYSNESMDLIFRIKIDVSGNLNGDGDFSVLDAVTLQKWLLGAEDVEIYEWAEADFDLNNTLDAFDLAIMKRKLIEQRHSDAAAS